MKVTVDGQMREIFSRLLADGESEAVSELLGGVVSFAESHGQARRRDARGGGRDGVGEGGRSGSSMHECCIETKP